MTFLKKKLFLAIVLLVATQAIHSQPKPPAKLTLGVQAGFQQASLQWSIAGDENGKNPNIYSELIWNRQRGPYGTLSVQYQIHPKWRITASFNQFRIASGKVTDRDYREDNRMDTFYNKTFNSNKGGENRFESGIQFKALDANEWSLYPFAQFHWSQQQLYLLGTLENNENLHSSYKTDWLGANMGATIQKNLDDFDLKILLAGGFFNYRARAQWNLIPEFAQPVSFRHKAPGYQLQSALNLGYAIQPRIRLFLDGRFTYGGSWEGKDEVFYVKRNSVKTQFNGVISKTIQLGIGLQYRFR